MDTNIKVQEQWVHWPPAQPYEDKYYLKKILFTLNACTFELTKHNKRIVLHFKEGIVHYRCTQDLFTLAFLNVLNDCNVSYGKKTFFLVKYSTYAKTIQPTIVQSYTADLLHFCLICDDVLIDILATHEPEFTFSLRSDPDLMPFA